jgi:FkbM family methyltransferase
VLRNVRRSRLSFLVSKVPYYLRSLRALGRIATFRSVARCIVLSDKRLDFRDGTSLGLSAVIDLLVVKETVVDDVYGLGALDAELGSIIVDVGAGIGDFTITAAKRFPNLAVHSFEPNPNAFRLLERNVQRQEVTNVEAAPIAIGTEPSYTLHDVSAGPLASAAVSGADDEAAVVPARRLDDVLPTRIVALLKVDCEGLEVDVLRSAAGTLDNAQHVVVEYHRHLLPDADRRVVELLADQGFLTRIKSDPYDSALGYVYASRLRRNTARRAPGTDSP